MATMPPPATEPSSDISEVIGNFIGGFLAVAFGAVGVMVGLTAAHELWPDVPPAGYLQCVCMLAGVSGISLVAKGYK